MAAWDTENWWEPKLDGEDKDPTGYFRRFGVPAEVENRYSNGQCTFLAYAMNERYGWPIKAEMMCHEPDNVAHAYCVMPDGQEIDILGPSDKVDSFEGGPVLTFDPSEFHTLYIATYRRGDADVVAEHLNDARKAVDLFIAPKVEGYAITPRP